MDKTKAFIDKKMLEVSKEGKRSISRDLAVEAPLALVYNGVSYVVMMVTPQNLENFILGFSITEGIISSKADIKEIEIIEVEAGLLAHITIENNCFENLKKRPRNLVGQSSCGLCGVEDLEAALPALKPLENKLDISFDSVQKALDQMPERQSINKITGATHAAAFANEAGDILALQEDVGRHSAFDKLVGNCLEEGINLSDGFALLTSRCSYELVQKAIVSRVPTLVAVSAPTSLAVDLAMENNLKLIALARKDSVLVLGKD